MKLGRWLEIAGATGPLAVVAACAYDRAVGSRWLERLARGGSVIVMDGGMGTTVEDRGIDVRTPLWGSGALVAGAGRAVNDGVHADFARAGAELLIANTHNASLAACAAFLAHPAAERIDAELAEELRALAPDRRAAHLAHAVNAQAMVSARRASVEVIVAAGVGNAEGAYATTSRLSADDAEVVIAPHAELVAALGADVVIFEVVSTRSDLVAAARVGARLAERGTPWALGLTTRSDGATHAGLTMDEVARTIADAPPSAVFVQCTRWDLVARALRPLRRALAGAAALGAYGNDGRAWIDRRWHGERLAIDVYADEARRWRDLGATIIGGCCGTTPEHIRALASVLSA